MDITKAPYAEFLEEAIGYIFENKPDKIALAATMPDGDTLTAYYQSDAQDKAIFAHHIYSDAFLEVVKNNIGEIKEALEELEEENDIVGGEA